MDSSADGRWIWLGLGVVSFIAVQAVVDWLHELRQKPIVSDFATGPTPPTIDNEDALKLETLQKLVDGSNYTIRAAAVRIVCERAVHSSAFDLLLEDVANPDTEVRTRALRTLRFLCSNPSTMKVTYQAAHAVITALELCLRDPLRSTCPYRLPSERHAMVILNEYLARNLPLTLQAGVVKRWLARYPFGDTEAERHEKIKMLRTHQDEDHLMGMIVAALDRDPNSKKQMRLAGLVGSSIEEQDTDFDMPLLNAEGAQTGSGAGPRAAGNSTQEQRQVRRRRREAIVVSDGRQPLRRENIIQRDDDESAIEGDEEDPLDSHIAGWAPW